MSDPLHKPDLDETINVTETHGRIARQVAAAARENKLGENGTQPLSLWLLIAFVLVGIVAGGVLSSGGKFFSYAQIFKPAYKRAPSPDEEGSGPAPAEALVAYSKKGQKIYGAKCSGCHGPDAKGDGANYPSLAGSAWVTGKTERLAMIILNGLHGPTSTGKIYGAAGMPAQGGGMTETDLAGLMTFLRNGAGNATGDIVTPEMAKAALDLSGKRAKPGTQVDKGELDSEHDKDLPGEKLDPKMMVDPATLAPAAAK